MASAPSADESMSARKSFRIGRFSVRPVEGRGLKAAAKARRPGVRRWPPDEIGDGECGLRGLGTLLSGPREIRGSRIHGVDREVHALWG
jgi:hypothetical protein